MKCARLDNGIELVVAEGDITRFVVDAIVNAANSLMIMGGGVAGAIKRRGGDEIEREAMKHAPVPVGRAVVTGAGRLPAKRVIHAPTMERPAMRIPLENAVKATRAALEAAERECLETIAFPAMGAGVGGLSVEEVAREMARVVLSHKPNCVKTVVFVAYGEKAYQDMLRGVETALGRKLEDCPGRIKIEQ
ncbi:MAG: macro domain-containing protein [Desulfurococcales archaeon]|nr:macro domain-containing protein [Desulfurococcales archaeon]